MEAIRQEIMIPQSHNVDLKLHIPDNIPTGAAEIFVIVQSKGTTSNPEQSDFRKVNDSVTMSEEYCDDDIFGIWKDRIITLDSLREKAWKRQ